MNYYPVMEMAAIKYEYEISADGRKYFYFKSLWKLLMFQKPLFPLWDELPVALAN